VAAYVSVNETFRLAAKWRRRGIGSAGGILKS